MLLSSSAISSATPFSSQIRSSSADSALPILPAALILGAIPNEIFPDLTSFPEIPITLISEDSPGLTVLFNRFSPYFTRSLFSPTSGTRSATVPTATRSAKSDRIICSSPSSAQASLNATPTPAYSVNRQGISVRWGSTTATQSGSFSPGR